MPFAPIVLSSFQATRPRHELEQARSLDWLARAHAQAEAIRARLDDRERDAFEARMRRVIARVACGPTKIATRGVSVPDAHRDDWDDNRLYGLSLHPHGRAMAARMRVFEEIVDGYFATAYADEHEAPRDLIHVTCTGYVSPSGAQKLVAGRGWGGITRVTHAYHMGCYAAVPALRIAGGAARDDGRVDIVHTELCSLHLDPSDHALDQLVVQSLFADGFIRYSATTAGQDRPGLRVLDVQERILADSAEAMTWRVGEWGMQMTLARDVPDRIGGALRGFVLDLFRGVGLGIEAMRASVFAVHPGGPKIIDRVRDILELDDAQVAASRAVLHDHGNMSSATLPHVWMRLLQDPAVPRGTWIPSLAFGPGLTLCGALLRKQ